MKNDLRDTAVYQDMAEAFADLYRAGSNRFHAINDIACHPSGERFAVAGEMYLAEGGWPVSRIGVLAANASMQFLSDQASSDRAPSWAPDGRRLAFLSDRDGARGVTRPFIAHTNDLTHAEPISLFDGEIAEAVSWSPDGLRLLVLTVGMGADAPAASGGASLGQNADDKPSWLPDVETITPDNLWRRAWIVDLETGARKNVGPPDRSIWEANWSGDDAIVAIVSDNPREGGWYAPQLIRLPLDGPLIELAPRSAEQLGGVTGSADGRYIAVVEGCFHHALPSGYVRLHDAQRGQPSYPRFPFEVTCVRWADQRRLFAIGTSGVDTVAAYLDVDTGVVSEAWRSSEGCGRRIPTAWPVAGLGFVCAIEAHDHPARVTLIGDDGAETSLLTLEHEGSRKIAARYGGVSVLRWTGRDGLEIDGFVATPPGRGPFPTITLIHGGPVFAFRNMWGFEFALSHIFVREGYAVFLPNPRGSFGRGQAFVRRVIGDVGGEDSHDILRGLDRLVADGVADPDRLGVAGGSYGGFMTSWLVTQTDRFAAACAISPMTNLRSQYFTAHHPEYVAMYVGDSPFEIGGAFDSRSPIMHARNVRTPVLNVAGAQDRTTPPGQAVEFHRALIEAGAQTELVIYPEEGHGVRRLEAQIDQAARIISWFRRFIPPTQMPVIALEGASREAAP